MLTRSIIAGLAMHCSRSASVTEAMDAAGYKKQMKKNRTAFLKSFQLKTAELLSNLMPTMAAVP